jgi:hypothetical protein
LRVAVEEVFDEDFEEDLRAGCSLVQFGSLQYLIFWLFFLDDVASCLPGAEAVAAVSDEAAGAAVAAPDPLTLCAESALATVA